jgi:hypothetical protein
MGAAGHRAGLVAGAGRGGRAGGQVFEVRSRSGRLA